jgi:hypothetical protein
MPSPNDPGTRRDPAARHADRRKELTTPGNDGNASVVDGAKEAATAREATGRSVPNRARRSRAPDNGDGAADLGTIQKTQRTAVPDERFSPRRDSQRNRSPARTPTIDPWNALLERISPLALPGHAAPRPPTGRFVSRPLSCCPSVVHKTKP